MTALEAEAIGDDLERQGYALIANLLSPDDCHAICAFWQSEERFRIQVDMARHGYGQGFYRYFAYPLPDWVQALRGRFYPPLAVIANSWQERLGADPRYPADHDAYLRRCHEAGQKRPTPLLLRYGPGDYNR
ncbi:MAG: 2OG-Fe(II) oxygenase, partial [Rhodospirillales bacterium]